MTQDDGGAHTWTERDEGGNQLRVELAVAGNDSGALGRHFDRLLPPHRGPTAVVDETADQGLAGIGSGPAGPDAGPFEVDPYQRVLDEVFGQVRVTTGQGQCGTHQPATVLAHEGGVVVVLARSGHTT